MRRKVAKALLTKAKWWKRKERGTEWVQEVRAFVTELMQTGAGGGGRGELMVR